MQDYAGMTVDEILRLKRAAILRAPLPRDSPSWDEIRQLTWEEIVDRQQRRVQGYKTIYKLLRDARFDK